MKTSYKVTLAILAALSASCRKPSSKVKEVDPEELFCAASGAWFTLLGHGSNTPGLIPAIGAAFSAAVGQLERSEMCSGSKDRQFGVNDVALMIHDELATSEVNKALDNLHAVSVTLDTTYNAETVGGDGRAFLTNSLQPIVVNSMAQFDRKGLTYAGAWGMATGLRVDIFNKIINLDLASSAADLAQKDGVIRRDVATMLAILDGIEPQVGKMQKEADRLAATYYEPTIYANWPVLDISRRDFCRKPVAFTVAERSFMDSFFSPKQWPDILNKRKKLIDDGPVCVDFEEQLTGCDGACADAVNAAVNTKIAETAVIMKTDLIDNVRHMHLLRDKAPEIRGRMQSLLDRLTTAAPVAPAAPAPAPAAARSTSGSSRDSGDDAGNQATGDSAAPASSTGTVRGR